MMPRRLAELAVVALAAVVGTSVANMLAVIELRAEVEMVLAIAMIVTAEEE